MSCPKLKIPWPRVLGETDPSVDHDQENWKAVERWSDGILKCIPASGAQVYCSTNNVELVLDGAGTYIDSGTGAGITFTLTSPATFAIHLSINAAGDSASPFYIDGRAYLSTAYTATASANSVQRPGASTTQASSSVNSAATRDAGTYTVYPSVSAGSASNAMTIQATCSLTVIIGEDTGDDCLSSPS